MVSRKPTQLYRLGHTAAAHPWAFILGWIAVFVAAALLLPRFMVALTGAPIAVTGSESQRLEQRSSKNSRAPTPNRTSSSSIPRPELCATPITNASLQTRYEP
jgi:uncharacterized membrane protein YdfJ with MMPL/SSD domain